MDISCSVHHKESSLKLQYGYIMACSSQGKLFKVAVAYIIKCSSQGKLFKVAVWIYDGVFISNKVV